MSRAFLMAYVLCIVACTDDSLVTPDRAEAASDTVASDLELNASRDRSRSALSGGATTVFDITADAFGHAAPNLGAAGLAKHDEGDEAFEQLFLPPVLGPVFDNISCEACHAGDGRGRPPIPGEQFATLLFRASIPGFGPHGGPTPIPGFGTQIQLRATPGFQPEANAVLTYVDSAGIFVDGKRYSLQSPRFALTGVFQALPARTLFSPRVAPVVFGLGLLEAIAAHTIEDLADSRDRDRNGISGRPNYVWDEVAHRTVIGRFGWKAGAPTLFQQAAGAYNGDMGITSTLFPAESCEGARPGCERHPAEIDDETVANVAFYTQTLGVPARRNLNDARVLAGEQLFQRSGCTGCHVATVTTGRLDGVPEVSNQVIHPYTDLLLHDMGPALADGRPDFRASGSEWRTPPLWGIGLVQAVNGHTNFLHDGRARTLLEAVLWHGGEADRARKAVQRLSEGERARLVAFLESL